MSWSISLNSNIWALDWQPSHSSCWGFPGSRRSWGRRSKISLNRQSILTQSPGSTTTNRNSSEPRRRNWSSWGSRETETKPARRWNKTLRTTSRSVRRWSARETTSKWSRCRRTTGAWRKSKRKAEDGRPRTATAKDKTRKRYKKDSASKTYDIVSIIPHISISSFLALALRVISLALILFALL